MALQFQIQQYPFKLGLSEGTDPHQVPPGTLTTAENVVWKQSGRLEKRFGTTALTKSTTAGGTITAGKRIFARGDELALVDGDYVYAYSSTATSWKNVDQLPNLGLTWGTLLETYTGVCNFNQGLYGNALITVWVTGDARSLGTTTGTAYAQITDINTGVMLMAPRYLIGAGIKGIQVAIVGSKAHVIMRNAADILVFAFDMTTYAYEADATLRGDAATGANGSGIGLTVISGTTIIIGYENTGNALKLYSYTYSGGVWTQAATGGITGEAGNGFECIALDGTAGESLYVVYGRRSTITARFAVANPATLVQTVAPVTLEASAAPYQYVGVKRASSTTCIATWTQGTGLSNTAVSSSIRVSNAGATTASTGRTTYSSEWASQPFLLNSRFYALMLDNTEGNNTGGTNLYATTNTVMVEIENTAGTAGFPHHYIGRIDLLIGANGAKGYLPAVLSISSTEVRVASAFLASAAPDGTNWFVGLRQVAITLGDAAPNDLWRAVTVGKESYLSGGVYSAYDGHVYFDYGVGRSAPFVAVASSPGLMAAGSYLYSIVPEYRSNAGMLHRGPTYTLTAAVTTGALAKVTLTITSIPLQTKHDFANGGLVAGTNAQPLALAVYRTVSAGTVLQRLTYEPLNTMVVDTATAQSVTFADTLADGLIAATGAVGLASRPALYTTGGILEDYAPPATITQFHHADRLFVLAGDRMTWWYSKAFQDDSGIAPGFNPAFRIIFDEPQIAGASMDDKAAFFSSSGVTYMQGTGPAANGQNSDFQVPSKIQSDVGCSNARSVVTTPEGVMFLSDRGIYLLSRGLDIVWIGRPVKDTLASYPTVTSAVLVAKHNQVRFTCNASDGLTGVVLVYDYVEKQWSTFRYTGDGTYGCPIADACIYAGVWCFVTTAGTVYQESTTSYLDGASTWVPMTLETAWVSAAGPLAFHSVRRLALHGTSYTNHDLTIQAGFDSDTSYPQSATFLAQTPVTTVGSEDAEVVIGTRRKCSTIRFKITDATPTSGTVSTGRGPGFDMMAIEVGIKHGFENNPATKRA